MPFGNSSTFYLIALSISSFGRLPSFIFYIKFSKEVPSIISSGSITLPRLFDIFFPSLSLINGWRNTYLNGTLSKNSNENYTILATQKKRISQPVSRIVFGKKALKSGWLLLGHPNVENGNNPDENQVSNTSSSWDNLI